MKSFFLSLIVAVMSFGFAASEAEAKRLGGGSSFGMQRQATPTTQPRQPAATQQQAPTAGAATAAQPNATHDSTWPPCRATSRWLSASSRRRTQG